MARLKPSITVEDATRPGFVLRMRYPAGQLDGAAGVSLRNRLDRPRRLGLASRIRRADATSTGVEWGRWLVGLDLWSHPAVGMISQNLPIGVESGAATRRDSGSSGVVLDNGIVARLHDGELGCPVVVESQEHAALSSRPKREETRSGRWRAAAITADTGSSAGMIPVSNRRTTQGAKKPHSCEIAEQGRHSREMRLPVAGNLHLAR